MAKIEILRAQLAHKLPQASLAEIFNYVCDLGIQRHETCAPKRLSVKKENVRRQVLIRDKQTRLNCGSGFAIQVDHKIPAAKGGPNTLENLRTYCRNCNQRAAVEQFGVTKMQKFWKSPYRKPRRNMTTDSFKFKDTQVLQPDFLELPKLNEMISTYQKQHDLIRISYLKQSQTILEFRR